MEIHHIIKHYFTHKKDTMKLKYIGIYANQWLKKTKLENNKCEKIIFRRKKEQKKMVLTKVKVIPIH